MAALSGKGQLSVHARNEERRGRGRAVKRESQERNVVGDTYVKERKRPETTK